LNILLCRAAKTLFISDEDVAKLKNK